MERKALTPNYMICTRWIARRRSASPLPYDAMVTWLSPLCRWIARRRSALTLRLYGYLVITPLQVDRKEEERLAKEKVEREAAEAELTKVRLPGYHP